VRHHADELLVQHVARGQAGDVPDVLGRQRRAVEDAALERQELGLAPVVAQGLGGRRGIAADERQRRRALEELLERLGTGLVGGRSVSVFLTTLNRASAARRRVRSSPA
jgi:hypothetical protein